MTPEEAVVQSLLKQNKTLATAESCTGGLISKRITDVPGASAVFECGIVSYSNRIKSKVLGVREETLKAYGAVSEQTAREMAEGALRVSGADLAVSVTGIAGPDADGTDKPVGLVYIALSDGKTTKVQKICNSFSENVREQNRNAAAQFALDWIRRWLDDA